MEAWQGNFDGLSGVWGMSIFFPMTLGVASVSVLGGVIFVGVVVLDGIVLGVVVFVGVVLCDELDFSELESCRMRCT